MMKILVKEKTSIEQWTMGMVLTKMFMRVQDIGDKTMNNLQPMNITQHQSTKKI